MTRAVALSSLVALSAFAADAPKPRVAVLYFEVSSNDPDMQVLKKGIAELMISDLAADPELEVVERMRIEAVMAELDLQGSKKVDQSTAVQVGKLVGAQWLVLGGITSIPSASFMSARIIAVDTGKTLSKGTAREQFKQGEVFDAEQKVSAALSAALAAAASHPPPPKKKQGSLSHENAVKYSQALDAIDKKDKAAAKEKLQQVVKAQPDFLLASLELDRLMK